MTCRFPDACRKTPEPNRIKKRYALCRGCAQSAARRGKALAINGNRDDDDWCPPHLRADLYQLRKRGDFDAAEIRRIIEDHMVVEARRAARAQGATT